MSLVERFFSKFYQQEATAPNNETFIAVDDYRIKITEIPGYRVLELLPTNKENTIQLEISCQTGDARYPCIFGSTDGTSSVKVPSLVTVIMIKPSNSDTPRKFDLLTMKWL